MAADLEGMHLQSQHAAIGAIQQENYEQSAGIGMLPVSSSKIPPDMSHAAAHGEHTRYGIMSTSINRSPSLNIVCSATSKAGHNTMLV